MTILHHSYSTNGVRPSRILDPPGSSKFLYIRKMMPCRKQNKKLTVATLTFFSVVAILIFAVGYYLHDKKILLAVEPGCENTFELDGAVRSVDMFIDTAPSEFYCCEKNFIYRVSRRLLFVPDEGADLPIVFAVSQFGVGVVWTKPGILKVLGHKVLVCSKLMDMAVDVRDDMKGLGSVVERKVTPRYVTYVISGTYKGRLQKIAVNIEADIYYNILGASDKKPIQGKLPILKHAQSDLRPLVRSVAPVPHDARPRPVGAVPPETRAALSARPAEGAPPMSPAEAASGKSQLMDDLLDRAEIPSDYGETMTALFRDKTQDDLVRGFAVQHIGLGKAEGRTPLVE